MPFKKQTPAEKRAKLLARLKEVDPEMAELVQQAEAEKVNAKEIDKAIQSESNKQRNEKHFWIEINRLGPEDHEAEAFVGAAGVSYVLKKGARVPVPGSVLDVLRNAVITGYAKKIDERTNVPYVQAYKYQRYPFSFYGEATAAEVENFRHECERQQKLEEGVTLGQESVQQMSQQVAREVDTGGNPYAPQYPTQ
jgi:hypothetical protein